MNRNTLYAVIIFAVVAGLVYWFEYRTPDAPVGASIVAPPAKEVARETKVDAPITTPTVKAYRPAVKAKLNLPQQVVEDEKQAVISTAKVKGSDRPHTVTTTLNTETGEAVSYVREDPLPWLAVSTTGEAGVYVGYKRGVQTARLQVRQSVLDVKAVRFGVMASLDQPLNAPGGNEYFVGVGAWYRW